MLLNSPPDLVEIWLPWHKREPMLFPFWPMPESPICTECLSLWLIVSSLMSPKEIKPELLPSTANISLSTEVNSSFPLR